MSFTDEKFDVSDTAPNSFLDIPFYADFNEIISDSTYCFDSLESMEIFKKNGRRLSDRKALEKSYDGQLKGIPLFQCKLKTDKSYLLNDFQKNLVVYKYIVIPNDNPELEDYRQAKYLQNKIYKFVCENKYHNVSIFKVLFASIKNEGKYLSSGNQRLFKIKFKDDSIKMGFEDKYNIGKKVKIDYKIVENLNWQLKNMIETDIDGVTSVKKNYQLIAGAGNNETVICELEDNKRQNSKNGNQGTLKLSNFDHTNPFDCEKEKEYNSHDNDFLCDFNEKIIAMVYVLLSHKRYKVENHINEIQ